MRAPRTRSTRPDLHGGRLARQWARHHGLDDGTLTATATQTDAAGNTGTGTLTATKDVAAPAVSVTAFPTVNTC